MKWNDVTVGTTVHVKGANWKVTAIDAPKGAEWRVTLEHPTFGTKTGSPPRDGDVEVAPAPKAERPAPKPADLDRGLTEEEDAELESFPYGTQSARRDQVAKDNGVPTHAVDDVTVRLTLGGTVIAHMAPGEKPAVSEVSLMDAQTLRNHLNFFHDAYPAETYPLDQMKTFHDEKHSHPYLHLDHEHSIPF